MFYLIAWLQMVLGVGVFSLSLFLILYLLKVIGIVKED
jgi:hypothetical protein